MDLGHGGAPLSPEHIHDLRLSGAELARANPYHRATIVAGLAKLTAFLTEIGVIDDAHQPAWADFGLVAAA